MERADCCLGHVVIDDVYVGIAFFAARAPVARKGDGGIVGPELFEQLYQILEGCIAWITGNE